MHDGARLLDAAARGDVPTLHEVIARSGWSFARGKFGRTPLHVACEAGHDDVVSVLLAAGPGDVDAKTTHGFTAVYVAANFGHAPCVKLLCDAGGDAQLPDAGGLTPLHIASRNGRAKVVEALLRHGVDADARDTIGWTALHWACHRGEAGVAAMLAPRWTASREDGDAAVRLLDDENARLTVAALLTFQ
mmetsp:Transcript_3178/g.11496  ORF Transcript_3178/g.11496 Transcript_3178/m.11496 type:complete len:190 (+) Transcript_3178:138-707(+)